MKLKNIFKKRTTSSSNKIASVEKVDKKQLEKVVGGTLESKVVVRGWDVAK